MNVGDERTKSLWMQTPVAPDAAPLRGSERCDTLIVGAGIAGLSCAYELVNAGQTVIVVDRGAIGRGMTARTTGHLAPSCDDLTSALIRLRGEATARLFQESQEAAVDRIEAIVQAHRIACNFRRLDGYLFPALHMDRADARDQIETEYGAARRAGAAVERVKGVPFKGLDDVPALRYARQGTFHPLKYLRGLVAAIEEKGGRIFAHSPVTEIDELKGAVRIATEGGATVTAPRAVFATNSPINDRVAIHTKMAPYRTYAMAFTLPRGTLPDALYWDMADPYHYVRLNPGPGNVDYLIVGGADHKTGEADDGAARFDAIEAWIRALVPELGNEVHRWSGQVLDTIDYCGFIGRSPGSDNVFVATGDSGQGITHGALAGMLLKDLIVGGASRWESVYDPSRKTPSAIVNYVSENLTAITNLAEYLMPGELGSLDELAPGQGGILRDGLRRIAAYRDDDGALHLRSATCTHVGCNVHWNSTERCWDCPCHGSHFAPDGSVLNGPAITPLAAADPPRAAKRTGVKAET
jgi:glycine/D-amino acid oxidase-like deaminating enzyme/nitrite reductase/ring-hydroxylating ferredoxin subunit